MPTLCLYRSHKKFSERKQVHAGMEPSKTRQQDGNNTTTLAHHPYILCHFALCWFVCIGGCWKALAWVVFMGEYI